MNNNNNMAVDTSEILSPVWKEGIFGMYILLTTILNEPVKLTRSTTHSEQGHLRDRRRWQYL